MILTNKEARQGQNPGVWKYGYDMVTKRAMTTEYGELQAAGAIGTGIPLSNAALDVIPDWKPAGATGPLNVHLSGTLDGVATP